MPKNFFKHIMLWVLFFSFLYYYAVFICAVVYDINWSEIYQLWFYDKDYDLVYKLFWRAIVTEMSFWNTQCWWLYASLFVKLTPLITKLIPLWSHIWMLKEDIKDFLIYCYEILCVLFKMCSSIAKNLLKNWGFENIVEYLWPEKKSMDANSIKNFVKNLAKKLEKFKRKD